MANSIRPSQSQVAAAQLCIKKTINARRRKQGFSRPVTSQQWSAPIVEKALNRSCLLLISNCCPAEWEDFAKNHYTEDDELDSALQLTEYAINGLMTFADETPAPRQYSDPENGEAAKEPLDYTAAQNISYVAASEYINYILEADDWVRDYRMNFTKMLTEQEMVDFLQSPLSQVLSFSDFRQFNLCPVTTRGRVTLIGEQEVPRTFSTMARRERAQYLHESLNEIAYQFVVELDRPAGAIACMTVERRGDPNTVPYYSWALEKSAEELEKVGGFREGGFIKFRPGGLGDRDFYPTFPNFVFSGYPGSVVDETYRLCTTIRENDFYAHESSVLRFMLMGVHASLFDQLYAGSDSIFVPKWGSFFSTRTVLNVPNWMLPEDLADYWRSVRPRKARDRRLPSSASMQMFRFVLKNTLPLTEPQWASLARQWHQETNDVMTRDKMYKTYHSVVSALFPYHPSKEKFQAKD